VSFIWRRLMFGLPEKQLYPSFGELDVIPCQPQWTLIVWCKPSVFSFFLKYSYYQSHLNWLFCCSWPGQIYLMPWFCYASFCWQYSPCTPINIIYLTNSKVPSTKKLTKYHTIPLLKAAGFLPHCQAPKYRSNFCGDTWSGGWRLQDLKMGWVECNG